MDDTVGVLLLNTGTPASSDPKDVRKYLTQFLLDGRVIDVPFWLREIIVKCFIVPFRYKNSAQSYSKIWTDEGSPLMLHSNELVNKVSEELQVKVALGLSYAHPSIEEGLDELKDCHKIIVCPLFPQYASATSGSVIQEVMAKISKWQRIPEVSIVGPFATHELFLDAWQERAKDIDFSSYDHILFSFHGLPLRHVKKQDQSGCCLKRNCCKNLHKENAYCYPAQCEHTAHELAKRLKIDEYTITFQSRLGYDKWLGPYTSDVIKKRRKKGETRLLVFAPSFVADCLETIYEIGMEYRDEFIDDGGEALDLVPSLNSHPAWIEALSGILSEYTQ